MSPHHPAARSRGLGPTRANPRESIDSASVTARSRPSSSTGTTWRSSRPRRTTRPPVRARSASRTSWMAASVDGTNASPTTTTSPSSKNARGVDSTSSECDTTELNAPNTPITPTMAKPSASDCSITCSSTVPPTVKPPSSCGSPKCGVVNSTSPTPCVVATVSSMRTTAKNAPTASRSGNARAYGPGRAWIDTATDAIPMTSATYTGLGASWTHAAAASAHTNHTPACHVLPGSGRRVRASDADAGAVSPRLRRGRHCGLTCPLDNGCAQPGCCVRFPDFGAGTGEVGARPTLTRNCERLCGFCRTPRARLPAVVHRATGAPRRRATASVAKDTALVERGLGGRHVARSSCRRVHRRAGGRLFSFALPLVDGRRTPSIPRRPAAADAAVAWLETQQQPDGGFELAAFPGFETRDATLAIAEDAQTGGTWSTSRGHDRGRARCSSAAPAPTPFDALDAYAQTIPTLGALTAGTAAKNIVLGARAVRVRPDRVRSRPATARRSTS